MKKENSLDTLDRADMVIVGNGIAGLTAAVEARRLAPEKSIVIMTSQSHPTINTPALKQFAIGKVTREQLLAYPAGTERMQRIHVVNASVEEIYAQEKYIRLVGGQGFGYDALLLATGSRPTGLPPDLPGQDFDGVLTLHHLSDYLNLRRRLNEVEEAVVIGGGPHAVETVMGLLYWGIDVHWLIRSETFLPRMLDRPASEMVLERVRRAGAKVYTETEVIGIVGRIGAVAGVVTTQQQLLPCQLVLVCTGTAPVTTLARHCDLPMKHQQGILVDDQLRTSVRNIYAAGDVAALRDPLTGKYAPRAQWYAAVSQGRTVASVITGAGEPEGFGVPWHATRLGDISLLTVGDPLAWPERIVPLTARRKGSYRRLSIVDNRLVGYLALGSTPPDSMAIKRIIDEGLSVREITKDLLRGEFDARKYFSGKRSYAVHRMISTGQVPTPLPPISGLLAGESQAMSRLPAPTYARPPLASQALQRSTDALPLPETEPLVRPVRAGSRSTITPRPETWERRRISEQQTLVGASPDVPTEAEEEVELVVRLPARQFIPPLARPQVQTDQLPNPHPSRSLWHYSSKLPAVKGRENVQK